MWDRGHKLSQEKIDMIIANQLSTNNETYTVTEHQT